MTQVCTKAVTYVSRNLINTALSETEHQCMKVRLSGNIAFLWKMADVEKRLMLDCGS